MDLDWDGMVGYLLGPTLRAPDGANNHGDHDDDHNYHEHDHYDADDDYDYFLFRLKDDCRKRTAEWSPHE